MTRRRRATAPPLRLRLRSGTAAQHTISYETQTRKPDGGWSHFKPSRWGPCKPLLRHPLARRIPRVAGKPDTAVRMRDEEEHVEAAKQDRLNGEEVTGDDAGRLRLQELTPARPASSRRMLVAETMKPSLSSSPQIRRCPQRGFSRASHSTSARCTGYRLA